MLLLLCPVLFDNRVVVVVTILLLLLFSFVVVRIEPVPVDNIIGVFAVVDVPVDVAAPGIVFFGLFFSPRLDDGSHPLTQSVG